jgi:hypothetical protein
MMAEFCKHCCISMWGRDTRDLADLGPAIDTDGKPWFYSALCETCGPIMVDSVGARCSPLDAEDDVNHYITDEHFYDPLPV